MPDEPANYGILWSREDLILAFDLYCRIPFRKTKASNPDVQQMASLIHRSPASVARKLGNFGSFDPELKKKGISGLPNTGKMAKRVWVEFNDDWNRLVVEADKIRKTRIKDAGWDDNFLPIAPAGPSERKASRKQRLHQTFFRSAIMSSYLETCCVSGISVAKCLIASHIVPWSVNEELRANPQQRTLLERDFRPSI